MVTTTSVPSGIDSSSNGSNRPSLTWLELFVAQHIQSGVKPPHSKLQHPQQKRRFSQNVRDSDCEIDVPRCVVVKRKAQPQDGYDEEAEDK